MQNGGYFTSFLEVGAINARFVSWNLGPYAVGVDKGWGLQWQGLDYLEYTGRNILKVEFKQDCPLQCPLLSQVAWSSSQ